jgi:hypothetical protein
VSRGPADLADAVAPASRGESAKPGGAQVGERLAARTGQGAVRLGLGDARARSS